MKMIEWKKVALVALVGLAATACSDQRADGSSEGKQAQPTAAEPSPVDDAAAGAQTEAGVGRNVSADPTQRLALKQYQCVEKVACANSPLAASSEAEAQWLQTHGYPSESELKALQALGDAQLADRVKQGSLPAMALYGERLALAGDSQTGLTLLMDAANRGSIYSYYGLSRVYSQAPTLKDNLQAAAFLRVAYILGDSKAAQQMLKDFPKYGPADYSVVDRRASELYKTFARERRPVVRPST